MLRRGVGGVGGKEGLAGALGQPCGVESSSKQGRKTTCLSAHHPVSCSSLSSSTLPTPPLLPPPSRSFRQQLQAGSSAPGALALAAAPARAPRHSCTAITNEHVAAVAQVGCSIGCGGPGCHMMMQFGLATDLSAVWICYGGPGRHIHMQFALQAAACWGGSSVSGPAMAGHVTECSLNVTSLLHTQTPLPTTPRRPPC